MVGKSDGAPASLSPQAKAFVRENLAKPDPPRTAEGIVALREETRAAYRVGCEAMRDRYVASAEDGEIGGVRVQELRPKARSPEGEAALLYLFGGGFVLGSPFEDLRISAPLAHHLGRPVFAPHYRLAPEHPFPAALDDVWAVYRALVDRFGADKLALAGESAGGNLALALLQRAQTEAAPLPAAAALLSPAADLAGGGDSLEVNAERDPTLTPAAVRACTELYTGGHPADDPLVSPLRGAYGAGFPPTLITTGTRDLFLSQAVRLHRVLRQAGAESRLNVWDGLWHVFEFYPEIPEAGQSLEEIAAFLKRYLD